MVGLLTLSLVCAAGNAQTTPPANTSTTESTVVRQLNNVRFASQFAGVDAGAKIQAAQDDLPSTGGIIFADFEGNQTISALHITKPVEIIFGGATFTVTSTINLTDLPNGPVVIRGIGRGQNARGTQFKGETGGVLFDLTGAQYVTFENIGVTEGSRNRSTVAFLFARSATSGYCQFNVLRNVMVLMFTNPSANGGHGSVAVYNNAAEHFVVENSYLYADNPLVITGSNDLGIASALTTHGTATTSTGEMTVSGPTALEVAKNGIGYPLYIEAAQDINLQQAYMVSWGSINNDFAMRLKKVRSLTVNAHIEGVSRAATISGFLQESKLHLTSNRPTTTSMIYLDTPNTYIDKSEIQAYPQSTTTDMFAGIDRTVQVRHSLVWLEANRGQERGLSNAAFPGTLFITDNGVGIGGTPSATDATSNKYSFYAEVGAGKAVLSDGVTVGGMTGPTWTSGTGAKSGPCSPTGSLFTRTDGGAGSTLYVCERGTWAAK
ncbi:MAG: hypothetical protein LAO07_13190 [Acidobacteriia bacterium]|nr:hypothetical protein [Terriglobia bacterium]